MVKLGCVNCGAALEIGTQLEVFACGYCGSQQRVDRAGGVVALRKVETAIKAVQRGTDRTAAELALPRLSKELAQLEVERDQAVSAQRERVASALRGRRSLTLIVFAVIFLSGPGLVAAVAGSSALVFWLLFALWAIGSIAAPIFVYRKTKIPPDRSSTTAIEFDERIGRVKAHIQANRNILDKLPD